MAHTVAVLVDARPGQHIDIPSQADEIRRALERSGHTVHVLACDAGLSAALRAARPDVALPVRAGKSGLDGSVQELLAFLGIPCVGADAASCRLAADRGRLAATVDVAAFEGDVAARTPETVRLGKACLTELGALDALDLVPERIPAGFPLCVKPACAGSHLEARKVDGAEQLAEAVRDALAAGDVLVQEWVEGVAASVCVLGDEEGLQVLPPIDASTSGPLELGALACDATAAQAIRSEIERAAVDTYLLCGGREIGRADLVWDGACARVVGFDPTPSLAEGSPARAAVDAAQIDLAELLDALVQTALERSR